MLVINRFFSRAPSAEKKSVYLPFSQFLCYILMINEHFSLSFSGSSEFYQFISVSLGRLVFPLFVYTTLQAYFYTSNRKKYIYRLFILAVISEPIYFLFFGNFINVIFLLLYSCLIFEIHKRNFFVAFVFNIPFYFILPTVFFTGLLALIILQEKKLYFLLIPFYFVWSLSPSIFVFQFLGLFFIFFISLNQKFKIPVIIKYSIYPVHLFILLCFRNLQNFLY